jgi:UDPglucose 6-dehydrogenase
MNFQHVNVLGYGFVGGAMGHLCKENNVNFCVYDIVKKDEPGALQTFNSLTDIVRFSEQYNTTNVYFICVPTPSDSRGQCDTSIVEGLIKNLNLLVTKNSIVIIKSTVQPGTTRRFNEMITSNTLLDVVFCPEFLTEKNFKNDMYNADFVLLGFNNLENTDLIDTTSDVMRLLYKHKKVDVYHKSYEECEMFKYTINVYLSVKVWYFNEIYELCGKFGIDYSQFRQNLLPLEPRIGMSHTIVPGDHGRGFSGSCLPKETRGMRFLQGSLGIPNRVLDEILKRNSQLRNE